MGIVGTAIGSVVAYEVLRRAKVLQHLKKDIHKLIKKNKLKKKIQKEVRNNDTIITR